jgi:hypothetical protein
MKPFTQFPSKRGDTIYPTTMAPTEYISSYVTTYVAEANDLPVSAGKTAVGNTVMFGQRFVTGEFFSALAIFADNCGNIRRASGINIPDSWREKFHAFTDLPSSKQVQFVGETVYEKSTIGLLSAFTTDGVHVQTSGMKWNLPSVLLGATTLRNGYKMYVGYSGEGLNYYDALVVLRDEADNLLWAKRFSTGGSDIANSVAECEAGIAIVGVYTENQHGLVLVLDVSGNVVFEQSFASSVLREVKPLRSGGYGIVGETKIGDQTLGLLIVGNADGTVKNTLAFELADPQYPMQGPIRGFSFEEFQNENFGIMFDSYVLGLDYSLSTVLIMYAEVNVETGAIISARYFGEGGKSKSYGRSIFTSSQGGYVIVGTTKRQTETYKYFIGQMENLRFPGIATNPPVPAGALTAFDVGQKLAMDAPNFDVIDMTGYRSISFENVDSVITAEVSSVSLGSNNCLIVPNTTPPTHFPTTPPTPQPSFRATNRPTISLSPTAQPSTRGPTREGETEAPTTHPTPAPSDNPSVHPTATPSSRMPSPGPTTDPSASPSSPPPTPFPTRGPSVTAPPVPTGQPSQVAVADDDLSLEGEKTSSNNNAEDVDVLLTVGIVSTSIFFICVVYSLYLCRAKFELKSCMKKKENKWTARSGNLRRVHLETGTGRIRPNYRSVVPEGSGNGAGGGSGSRSGSNSSESSSGNSTTAVFASTSSWNANDSKDHPPAAPPDGSVRAPTGTAPAPLEQAGQGEGKTGSAAPGKKGAAKASIPPSAAATAALLLASMSHGNSDIAKGKAYAPPAPDSAAFFDVSADVSDDGTADDDATSAPPLDAAAAALMLASASSWSLNNAKGKPPAPPAAPAPAPAAPHSAHAGAAALVALQRSAIGHSASMDYKSDSDTESSSSSSGSESGSESDSDSGSDLLSTSSSDDSAYL